MKFLNRRNDNFNDMMTAETTKTYTIQIIASLNFIRLLPVVFSSMASQM